MKNLILFLSLTLVAGVSFADEAKLRNCFAEPSRAQFFAHSLKKFGENQESPIMLLNDKKEVVGVITVKVKNNEEGQLRYTMVTGLELCSNLEVDEFYYADDESADIRNWQKISEAVVTQDEGMIVMKVKPVEKQNYATLMRADFEAYDVYDDEDTDENNGWGKADYIGHFFFYLPKGWN